MRKYRKHAIVVIFIVAAIITPPDVFSQTLVAIPLLLLYEISIFVSVGVMKRKEQEHNEFMDNNVSDKTTASTS
jgi:sec-independent protein translocase protein TatC